MLLRNHKVFGLAVLVAGLSVLLAGVSGKSRGEAPAAASKDVKAHRAALRKSVLEHPRGGSVEGGRKLFFDSATLSCFHCHRVNGKGGKTGPDLSGVGARAGVEYLVDSVLYPSKHIVFGYQRTTVTTTDGRQVTGVLKARTAGRVELKVGSKLVRLVKAKIQSVHLNPVSPMPNGLVDDLTRAQFADLIAYLASLKGRQVAAAKSR